MQVFFTPGPAQLYPTFESHVQQAIREQIGSISHRSKQFRGIYQFAVEQLRELLNIPADRAILFSGSATEIWERIIQNCAEKETTHFVNGSFSKRFYEFSVELGKKAQKFEAPFGQGFDITRHTVSDSSELICLTHNETSSGVSMPLADIHYFKKTYPGKIVAVDVVSSAPYPDLDWSLVDTAFFSVQKAFGLPAGLGVWIVNETCLQKAEQMKQQGQYIGTHHSLPSLWKNYLNYETPATPNVFGMYLLGKVVKDMNAIGVRKIRQETEEKATLLYQFLEQSEKFRPAVENPAHRSQTVIVAEVENPAEKIASLKEKGLVIGSGYGAYKDKQVRIANFPATSFENIQKLIKELE
ncbi:aminotransferase class V-fold PLP-dependent enzyme [Xanthocytophaga agilis]|uniref:phosphoserine transaminase n=1 Tax=Xanthocytophaga agilis TaxID=3048010 RepID=A0AAE3R0G2_9BACT|nr:aminotransferase class V-fold PLP-dependent enzyme [Xanthocytophaga agilis]MDJ1499347.1 aminotransferase class V-fold PLP-dependent enzyme [Xanthocytophaga agilis]